jgi:predicted transcriptional regulator
MPRKPSKRPTDAELAILQVLWEDGPSTVRDVHEKLTNYQTVGYTTVLKTLQIMTDKGLVRRDESQRAHVYEARRSEEHTQKRLLGDLLERAYRGSASRMVVQALSSQPASKQEIEEIRRILDDMSREAGDDNN